MERLTKRSSKNNMVYLAKIKDNEQDLIGSHDTLMVVRECFNKLAEYEDLEEQGLLLRVLCKIYDKVWGFEYRCKEGDNIYSSNMECDVCPYSCDSHQVPIEINVPSIKWIYKHIDNFGKTVFLTKEAAEREISRRNSHERHE